MSTIKQKERLVLLPTEDKSNIWFRNGKLEYNCSKSKRINPHHLYIVSSSEVKVGDWAILKVSDKRPLYKVKIESINSLDKICTVRFPSDNSTIEVFISGCSKILATTDVSLTIKVVDKNTCKPIDSGIMHKYKNIHLPQPSQGFIENYIKEYNNGNIITDILVEYEVDTYGVKEVTIKPLVSEDNTVSIHKVKGTYSTDEVIDLLYRSRSYKSSSDSDFEAWVKENT